MSEILLRYIGTQVVLFSILIVFLIFFYISNRTFELEKRILKFSLHAKEENNTSFLDKITYSYRLLIKSIATVLAKNKSIKDYSDKYYDKYVTDTKIIRDEPIFIVSNKLLFGILSSLAWIVTTMLRKKTLNIDLLFILLFLLMFIIGYYLPDIFMYIGNKRRQRKIERDFLKAIIIMNNAFKSGRSIIQAIEVVSTELDGVVSEEFKKMYIDLSYGLDLEVVFERFSKRINLEESKYMASSLVIINKTGGDIVKVFSSIEKSFLSRKRLNDELKSATALSNFVFRILVVIPLIIVGVMSVFNKGYFEPFIKTTVGNIILLLIVIIYIIYIIIIKKVMKVKE